MAANPYTLNGIEFPTKEAVRAHVQSILTKTAPGTRLLGDDHKLMLDLLALHYDAKAKIGCGVAAIEVRRSPGYNSKGFYLVRCDGSSTDFSYLKCLDSHALQHKFIDACRYAIQPHIDYFRSYFFRTSPKPTCPLTGEPLTLANAHVDHCPPFTFDRIVRSFAVLCGINQEDPRLVKHGDNLTVPLFASEVMRDRFVQYHNNNAQLRVISDKANITLVTQSVRDGLDKMTSQQTE